MDFVNANNLDWYEDFFKIWNFDSPSSKVLFAVWSKKIKMKRQVKVHGTSI